MSFRNRKAQIAGLLILIGLLWYFLGTETAGAAGAVIALGQQSVKRKRARLESAAPDEPISAASEIKEARSKARKEADKWLDQRF